MLELDRPTRQSVGVNDEHGVDPARLDIGEHPRIGRAKVAVERRAVVIDVGVGDRPSLLPGELPTELLLPFDAEPFAAPVERDTGIDRGGLRGAALRLRHAGKAHSLEARESDHCLARAGRPREQHVMTAGGGDLERAPGSWKPAHVGEVDGVVQPLGRFRARRRRGRRPAAAGAIRPRPSSTRAARRRSGRRAPPCRPRATPRRRPTSARRRNPSRRYAARRPAPARRARAGPNRRAGGCAARRADRQVGRSDRGALGTQEHPARRRSASAFAARAPTRRPDAAALGDVMVRNAPAGPAMHNHRCPEHGQVMQAPKASEVVCGRCGRVCTPDENPA